MRIKKITLTNFQGIKSLTVEPDGKDLSVFGYNETGKTTLASAITWLLFDKPINQAKGFTPKTRNLTGEEHGLDHGVDAQFELSDGRMVTLSKVFRENWTKKRGSTEKELSGNVVEYAIDAVPVKQKDYDVFVLSLANGNAEAIKILTMPDYFPDVMNWEGRRKILIDLCGDVSDADVLSMNPELSEISEFLLKPGTLDQRYTPAEYREIVTAGKRKINEELKSLPGRIDEAKRSIPAELPKKEGLSVKTDSLKKSIDELAGQKNSIKSGDAGLTAKNKQIADINLAISEARTKHNQDQEGKNEKTRERIKGLRTKRDEQFNALVAKKNEEVRINNSISELEAKQKSLLAGKEDFLRDQWDTGLEVCHSCGQSIQRDKIDAAKASFNLNKSQKIESITKQIEESCSDVIIQKAKDALSVVTSEKQAIETKISSLDKDHSELETKIIDVKFHDTAEYKTLSDQLSAISLTDDNKRIEDATAEIEVKIKAAETEYQGIINQIALCDLAERQKKRIGELEDQQKTLAREYEQIEKGLYLCEQFIAAKMSMLSGKINDKFQSVKFQLFKEQINGGIDDKVCEVMIPSPAGAMVPYAFANNAGRINAGLEIISTLSEHWGISFPVIVDNAEAVCRLIPIKAQLIALYVSEKDKVLRFAVHE
jgi:hypothetical protein